MSDNRSETNRKRKLSASTPVHSSTASKGTSSLSLSSIESKTNKRIRRKNVTFNYTTDIYEPKIYDSLSHDDDTKDKTLTLSDDKMASEYEFSSFPSCQQDSCKVGDHDRTYTKIKDNYTVNFHHSFRSESFLLEFPKPEKNFFPTSLDERNKPVRKKRPTRKKTRYPITTPSLTQSLGWMSIHNVGKEILKEVRANDLDLKYEFIDDSDD